MPRGQTFDDFLAEEIADDPSLAEEIDEAFDDMRLAVRIAMCREERGMSQQQLARASGIAQPMISRIERGVQQPTWPTIRKLLEGLNARLEAGPDGEIALFSAGDRSPHITPTESPNLAQGPNARLA